MRDDQDDVRYFDLCNAQLMMWFDAHVSQGDGYRLGAWFKTDLALDPDILAAAFARLAENHDALRLRVDTQKPRQWVSEDTTPPLALIDIDDEDPDAAFQAHMRTVFEDPMPFGNNPLWRVDLLRADGLSFVVLSFHHIIVDTISVQMALSQVLQTYLEMTAGGTVTSKPAVSTFQTVLDADRHYNDSTQFKQDLAHWSSRYDTTPQKLIAADPIISDDPFADITFRDIPLDGGFLDAAQAANLLPHRAVFGILAVVLARRFGQTDLSCGMALHRRDRTSLQTVSMLAGLIPLRATFEDWWSLEDCIAAFSETLDEDLRHNRLPLDALYREIQFTGKENRGLFDVTMSFVPGATGFTFPPGSSSGLVETREASPISFHATSDPVTGAMSYRIAINPNYKHVIPSQVLADVLDVAIAQFAQGEWVDFGDVSGISEDEKGFLTAATADVLVSGGVDLVGDVVRGFGVSRCDAPALACGVGSALSYGEFWSQVRARGLYLGSVGVERGTRVGVLVDLGVEDLEIDLIVSLFGIWEAGGVFVPLNAEDPVGRLGGLVVDARLDVVLCWGDRADLAARLVEGQSGVQSGVQSGGHSGTGPVVVCLDSAAQLGAASGFEGAEGDPDGFARGGFVAQDLAYIYFTSGTTGRPKAVAVSHGSLGAFSAAIAGCVPGGEDSVVLSGASLLFDAVFMDIAASLYRGGVLVRLSPRSLARPGVVASACEAHGGTYLDLTPTVWRTVLGAGWVPPEGFTAVTGGEAIDGVLASRITGSGARLYNSYGPTEATVVTVAGELTAQDIASGHLAIGRPLAGTRAVLLDGRMRPVAPGVPGRLYLGGPQLALGYLGDGAKTAACFVADPSVPGGRLYDTGDLAVWYRDGRLGYLGRSDSQIKIRGMRVELGEIEAVLEGQPGVVGAAAVVQGGAIAAFVVVSGASAGAVDVGDLDPDMLASLQGAVSGALPLHMRPRVIAPIGSLPLSASGKLDRKALEGFAGSLDGLGQAPYEAPEGELETLIAGHVMDLVAQETGRAPERVSRHDSFFDLGGHSLMAVRLIARIEADAGASLPLRALFEAPTLKDLASALAQAQTQSKLPALTRADRSQPLPLSYAQERLWFVERFAAPGTIAEVMGFDLEGALDAERLRAVFGSIYARHEALRLRVETRDGSPVQVFGDPDEVPWCAHDLRGEDAASREAHLAALRGRPVDPSVHAFRADLVRTGEASHTLVIALHHMVYDGVSLAVILGEIGTLWAANGSVAGLPSQDVSYGDYGVWQRAALAEGPLQEGLERFVSTLSDPPAPLALPRDRDRPEQPTHAADTVPLVIPPELTRSLRDLARGRNASLFIVLQTALAVLLGRESRQSDVIIGTVAAGRAQAAVETAVGPFFNMIALRHHLEGSAPFSAVLERATGQALQAFEDQLVPFEAVIERTVTRRDAATAVSPLFQVLFQLHTEAAGLIRPLRLGSVQAQTRPWSKQLAMQDLTFDLFETDGGLEGRITYATELFDGARIAALAQRYITLLGSIVAAPDQACADLESLPADQLQALEDLSTADVLVSGGVDLVGDVVRGFGVSRCDAPALACGVGSALSYGEFWSQVRARGLYLGSVGVERGTRVGVLVDLGVEDLEIDLIVSLFGIWEAGGVFVPLNAEDPVGRLGGLVVDARLDVVLCWGDRADLAARLVEGQSGVQSGVQSGGHSGTGPVVVCLDSAAQLGAASGFEGAEGDPDGFARGGFVAQDLAYIYFTSGTTGRPKAVAVSHGSLGAFSAAIAGCVPGGEDSVVLSGASLLFDAVFMDIAASLYRGGVLVRLSPRSLARPGVVASACEAHGGTYLDLTPTVWRTVLGAGWVPPEGFTAVTGGEAIDGVLASRITGSGARLYNSYGPTEATVVTVAGELTAQDIASGHLAIGRPLAGTRAVLLDGRMRPVAPGVPGRLYLGGPQLALGYLGDGAKTAACFVADPSVPGGRLYDTGDLAVWYRDGRLGYLGRSDSQIKIRGMRVELGEIEAVLEGQPGVVGAAAVVQGGAIAAFVVVSGASAGAVDVGDLDPDMLASLQGAVSGALPLHMRPRVIAPIGSLPLSASGKLDRKALEGFAGSLDGLGQAPYEAPEGELETLIAGHVMDLVAQETGRAPERVSRHDSFFDLGGHSLMAVRLIARIEADAGASLPLRALFEAPTLKDLASALAQAQTQSKLPALTRADRSQPLPLSYAQERLWFVERFAAPGTIAEVMGFDLEGALDAERLRAVFGSIYARHEALRLRVETRDGSPVQVFGDPDEVPWCAHDLRGEDAASREAHLAALRGRPVDPSVHAFRADLVRTGEASHTLVIALHHMVYDGVSLAVILGEIGTLWAANGSVAGLPSQDVSYGDYGVWQRAALAEGPLQEGLERFVSTLSDPPAPLALPRDRDRPEQPTHAADTVPLVIPPELTRSLRDLARGRNASLFIVLQTALAVLLGRESRQSDVIIGTVAAGRAQAAVETAVGPFFNMIALRHHLEGSAPFSAVLERATGQALQAFEDQLVPFEAVIERTVTRRDAATAVSPLFQVLFQLHTEAAGLIRPLRLGSVQAQTRPWSKQLAMQDLTFDLFETDGGLEGRITYATELFDGARIAALAQRYITLLGSIVAAPDQACADLESLPADQLQALEDLSTADVLVSGGVDLVGDVVRGFGVSRCDAPALACGVGSALSYGEFWSQVRARGLYLGSVGVERGTRVGVLVDLGVEDLEIDLIVSLFGIWEAGGVFVPLNAEDPVGRLGGLVVDARLDVVLCWGDRADLAARLVEGQSGVQSGVQSGGHSGTGPVVVCLDSAAQLGAASGFEGAEGDPDGFARGGFVAQDLAYIYFTSGTTGRPKAVAVSHGSLGAFSAAIAGCVPGGEDSVVLSGASLLFDAVFMDIAASLYRGGVLVRLSPRSLARPGVVASACEAHGGTYLDLTPTVWRTVLGAGWVPPEGFTAVTGGEAIDGVLASRITGSGARLYNSYGPTEATVVTVAGELTAQDIASGHLAIGRPLAGTRAVLLDGRMRPVAPGVPGRLYLGGPQLALGYLGDGAKTAACFVADPSVPGGRLYDTGDLAVWYRDGRLGYLGRSDSQIKIRGMRVELGEIEAVLEGQPGVVGAAAVVQGGAIAAFVVVSGASAGAVDVGDLDPDMLASLQGAVSGALPLHMRPRVIAPIGSLPLSASGKLDRKALEGFAGSLDGLGQAPYEAPEGELETLIAGHVMDLVAQETGRAPERVSRHDSFFDLGGHSLMAVRLIARIEADAGASLPLRALFEAPTLKDLASALAQAQTQSKLPALTRADRSQPLPLSYAQERLWFVERFAAPGTIAEVMGFDLEGALDAERLRAVFGSIYARHEALRLRVETRDGSPVQVFGDPDEVPWCAHDLRGEDAASREAHLAALRGRPVDPSVHAFRADLVRTGEASHTLVIALHHMVYDGVSLAVILGEIGTLWAANGSVAGLPSQDVSYGDYGVWQRAALAEGPLQEGLERFVSTLSDPPAPLALPRDRDRPEQPTHAADTVPLVIPPELTRSLRDLARGRNASLFIVLQTALAVLLGRESRQSDVIIGTVAAGRAQAAVETAVGPFFNMIALRHHLEGSAPFSAVLERATGQALQAFEDQLVPFEAVIERTVTRRDAATAVSPLFQVLFQLHTEAAGLIRPLRLGSVQAQTRPWSKQLAMQDLTFDLFETDGGLEGRITYATELFDGARIAALAQRYITLLGSIVAAPDQACADLESLPADQLQALEDLSTADVLVSGGVDLVGDVVRGFGVSRCDAPALACGVGSALSYGEFWSQVRARGLYLGSVGVERGTRVGVLVDLGVEDLEIDLIVSLFGIWEAGGVFVPLNAEDPVGRLGGLVVDARLDVVLCWGDRADLAARLVEGQSGVQSGVQSGGHSGTGPVVVCLDSAAQLGAASGFEGAEGDPDGFARGGFVAQDLAYIYFTSGTTGRPKAVAVSHGSLGAFSAAIAGCVPGGEDSVVLSGASLLFDAVFMDIAASLYRGGVLVRLSPRSLARPGVVASACEAHGGTYLDLTPTVWRTVLGAGWVPPEGFTAVTGGEAIDGVLASRITGSGARLYNSYGPTEATVVTVAGELTAQDIASGHLAIGRPLAGTRAVLLDGRMRPVAPGVPGRLYLGGPQLALGYLGDGAKTAACFVADPSVPGGRLYDTGDLAVWYRDGRLGYLGRSDSQIKIRGMRVELGEIEAVLEGQPGVVGAAAVVQGGAIAAFVVVSGASAGAVDVGDLDPDMLASLQGAVSGALPLHMRPRVIAPIGSLPLSASGKLDRKALEGFAGSLDGLGQAPYEAPEGELETLIAGHVMDLVAQETGRAPERVSRHDSFFDLGGHSLMAVRLIARIEADAGASLPLRALFEAPTLKDLASALAQAQTQSKLPALTRADRSQPLPLSYAQERLWFVERFAAPGTIAEVMGFDLEGALDAERLRAVFGSIYARHEALRLRVETRDGSPVQVFGDPDEVPWCAHDLRGEDAASREAHLAALRGRPVDPSVHAFRADLVRTGEASHTLVIALHHMVYDGVSLAVILGEIGTLWAANGSVAGLPSQDVSYGDYGVWQRAALAEGPLQEGLERFVSTLSDPPAPLALPRDRDRPEQPTHAADTVPLVIPPELTRSLRDLARGRNASLFIVLQTALAVLLGRESRQSDVIIGTVAAGRAQAAVETAVGPFFNMIALRHHLEGSAPFSAVLERATGQALQAFEDQLVPFEAVIERTVTRRDAATAVSPLFQVLFQLHTEAAGLIRPLRLGSVQAQTRPWSKQLAMQDLTFDLFETDGGLEGRITYATELFDGARIAALAQRYITLLGSIVAAPDQACADLESLPADQLQALEDLSTADVLVSGGVDLVGDVVRGFGVSRCDAPALACGVGSALSYGEFWSQVRARGLYLGSVGVERGTRVGVLVDLGVEDLEIDLIVSLFGIWEAGGVFVPLNAEDPVGRLGGLVVDARLDVVLCWGDRADLAARLVEGQSGVQSGVQSGGHSGTGPVVVCLDSAAQLGAASGFEGAEGDPDGFARGGFVAQDLAYIYFTSGTTGRPKAVAVSHGSLGAFSAAIAGCVPGGEDSVVLSGASLLFDAVFMDIAASLYRGGVLVRLSPRSLARPGVVASACEAHGGTYLDLTPTVWRTVLGAGWVPPEGFTAVTGGEAIDGVLASRITGSGARLYNSYGPTEATVVTVAGELTAQDIASGHLAIGRPLAGTRAVLLDGRMRPVAPGVPGRLYLGGPQLALGYLGDGAKTAACFVADPSVPGGRLYDTGDLAVWYRDGRLGYLGRSDSQIKIRGMRVELGEIEAVLEGQPGVVGAAAVVQGGAIAAFVVVSGASAGAVDVGDLDPDMLASLQGAVSGALPLHMRPRVIAPIGSLPLSASGKLDRKALEGFAGSLDGLGQAPYEAPEGELETLIAGHVMDLVAQETGRAPERVSRHDSFFDLGGHSLMAVRLIARIEADAGASLPLRALFEAPTLKDLASALAQAQTQSKLPALTRADRSQPLPLSYAQERLWFLDKLDRDASAAYRIDGALRLAGSLNVNALTQAFDAVIDRHDSLRTRFSEDETGNAISETVTSAKDIGFALETAPLEGDAEQQVNDFLNAPYDLARGPLFRALLLDLGQDEHVLAVGGHHAILDGWSVALLFGEVAEHYQAFTQGRIVHLAPLPLQYGDYAVWQRNLLDQEKLSAEADWWRKVLIGAPEAIALPTDRQRSETMDYRGRSVRATLPRAVVEALKAEATGEQASLFMGLQAALSAYLMRVGAGEDIVIGTAVAGRAVPELDPMVGFFINTVALRNTVVPSQNFRAQLAHAKKVTLDAFDHQDLPFDAVIEAVRPVRSMSHAPVVQVMLILQNVPRASEVFDFGGLDVDYFLDRMADKGAQFDMAFECAETEDGLDGILTYATALFDDETAQRLLDGFFAFVTAAAQAPETALQDLPVMSAATKDILAGFEHAATLSSEPLRVPDLIAQADPSAIAVVDELGGVLSYRDLDDRAVQIAAAMQAAGAREGSVVALCLTRSVTLPAAILAAWKIGAAFMPLNPNDPVERRAYMLQTAQACLLVVDEQTRDAAAVVELPCLDLDMPVQKQNGAFEAADGHLAYVIFTSGSTGKPKGVAVSHGSLGHLQAAVMQADAMGADDCLISGFENTFDVFVRDVALTLAAGAKLVLAQTRSLLKPGHFAGLVETHKGTWLQLTPTVWRVALQDGWRPDDTMRAEAGGETMDASLATMLGEKGARVVNAYGPTEVTAVSVQGIAVPDDLNAGDAVPIGKPLPGLRAYVLDSNLNPVPPGVPGELVLAGPQVADGYIGQPTLTAEVFIADPDEPEDRAYRTGDLVRWRNDGRLDFLGRIDAQVKIRGMRIELGEIETAIAALPAINAVAVAPQTNGSGQTSLVGYIVQDGQTPEMVNELAPEQARIIRTELAKSLPEYMIPQVFAALPDLPLTPSGKLDRKALPVVEAKLVQADYVPLDGPTETLVAEEIAQLLGENASDTTAEPDKIGRHDSFFALGGHSMLAMQLINRLEAATGLTVPLRAVFEAVDIAELAATVDRLLDGEMPGAESEVDDAQRDIDQVKRLPAAPDGPVPALKDANCVLLTGGTGFLGRYLLRDLLERTRGEVICVVRADTPEAAQARVIGAVNNVPGVTLTKAQEARIIAIPGELSKPQMGLTPSDLARIVANVDTIIHNGAEVHAMKPYAMLRASNTLSVLDLLHIMSEGRAKQMIFVSTLGTLEVELDQLKDGFDPQVMTPANDSGYNLSKWAAERMLITARDKGYRSTILRPGLVIGCSQTGYYQTSDIGQSYTNLFLDTGSVPDAMSSFGLPWVNVDRAADMILDLGQSALPHGIGHVFDYGAMPSDLLADVLDVAVVPASRWLASAIAVLEADKDHPSQWLLARLRGQAADLEGIPDEMIPVEDAVSMFKRFAPPALPQTLDGREKPTPQTGIAQSIKWLKNRTKD